MLTNINEKKKLKLNMNLNKNNIKYYFSEYKMKQMIDNLQQNLENDEELRISIEKYRKDSKPHSAKNRLLSITGTNNSTNQSLKNEDKLTNNISDIDNNTIKNKKTKSLEGLSSQKENDNSFDSLNFNEKKIKKKNTFYQFFSKHSRLTNLYLPENNTNNTAIEYIPFNKKNSNEVNSNKNNLKNNNLTTNNIYNNSNLNNPITFNNLTKNFINSSSIKNSYNSYNKNINNTYKNFPIIRSTKSKLNKTQKLKLPEIHSKLSNKSCNDENIDLSIKSFDNKYKINLFFENQNNNTIKIKEKKTSLYKNLRENNYSPIVKNKKNYKKQITLSYQKKRRSLESKNELNIEKELYQFNIDMNEQISDNYIDKNVNKKIIDYFEKILISKNKEINVNKNNKCISIINKKIDLIFYDIEKKIKILEQKINNNLNNKLLNEQKLLNKKIDFNIENKSSIREQKFLYYNYTKILNKENEINDEIFINQNIKNYILNKYYNIIEDIFNYCYKNNINKKIAFNSYINNLKINKIKNKNLHSLTYHKNFEKNLDKKKKTKDDIIKNLYFQAISNLDNKCYLDQNITRDINHQLYKKIKFINFVQYLKQKIDNKRTYNKKVILHKNSMKNFYKHNSKQIKSQFSNQITKNQQFSKTSPNLVLNNNSFSTFKKSIYSNLNMNDIIRNYEKKKSNKLNKENFNDSIIKKILISPQIKVKNFKSKFDINMKETYSNNNILIPEFGSEKSMLNKKDFEAFSSSNKYITQIQTDKIKSEELTNLGEDILGILNYYIKDNNENLAIKVIKDNLEFINLNYKNKEGMTLLLLAIKYNCSEKLIQFLLDKGADPNIYDVRILYKFNILV